MSEINWSQVISDIQLRDARENSGTDDAKAAKRGAGWLEAFAIAMGKLIEKQGNALMKTAESIGDKPSAADSTKLTVESQMYSMFIQAVSTALKSMGEGQTAMARKGG